MESACYAQACHKFNIPFVAIRFISDVIGSDGQIENYVITEDDTARDKRTNEFVIKDNKLHKVTHDHTLVNLLITAGELTEEEARNHPDKNIITHHFRFV